MMNVLELKMGFYIKLCFENKNIFLKLMITSS